LAIFFTDGVSFVRNIKCLCSGSVCCICGMSEFIAVLWF